MLQVPEVSLCPTCEFRMQIICTLHACMFKVALELYCIYEVKSIFKPGARWPAAGARLVS